jgi:hypothetical protein
MLCLETQALRLYFQCKIKIIYLWQSLASLLQRWIIRKGCGYSITTLPPHPITCLFGLWNKLEMVILTILHLIFRYQWRPLSTVAQRYTANNNNTVERSMVLITNARAKQNLLTDADPLQGYLQIKVKAIYMLRVYYYNPAYIKNGELLRRASYSCGCSITTAPSFPSAIISPSKGFFWKFFLGLWFFDVEHSETSGSRPDSVTALYCSCSRYYGITDQNVTSDNK